MSVLSLADFYYITWTYSVRTVLLHNMNLLSKNGHATMMCTAMAASETAT